MMNSEQKQYARDLVSIWRTARNQSAGVYTADKLADLLQELADAPTPEPFGYFKAEPFGWTDCAETDDGAIALFTAPPAPSVPDGLKTTRFLTDVTTAAGPLEHGRRDKGLAQRIGDFAHKYRMLAAAPTPAEAPADVARWIDPNDKTQPQYLPHVGERVLFCHDGKTYYGKHTGGSFISFTHPGNTYPTWECHWTYPPKAIDAAMNEKGGA